MTMELCVLFGWVLVVCVVFDDVFMVYSAYVLWVYDEFGYGM